MELSYFFLYYFAPILLILVTAIYSFKRRQSSETDKKLPPGSLGWPVLGEIIEFANPEKFVSDRMKKYSPDIFKTKILGEETAVICGPKGNKFLFSNEQKLFTQFLPHPMQKLFLAAGSVKFTRQDELQIIRAPGFLGPEALVKYVAKMDSITQQQMKTCWENKDQVKAYPQTKILTLTLACRFFMGSEDPELVARMINNFNDITEGMHSFPVSFPGTKFYKACKAAAAVRKELRAVIGEKKAELANGEKMLDILSHMIVATDASGKHKPEAEIADQIMGLLVAGYSTVSSAMTFFLKYVGERPDIYHIILAEQMEIAASKMPGELLEWDDMQKMKYSWNVINEVLRLTPPIQGTFREALADFTYANYTIPKGWKMFWTVSSTNKNPEYFPDPEKFDPSRYDGTNHIPAYTFVPFGGGPRTCPGKEYARLAILTFVHNVVKRFQWDMVLPNERIIGQMMPVPEKGLLIRLRCH